MKREIICVDCEPRVRAVVSKPYPGEHDKWVKGKMRDVRVPITVEVAGEEPSTTFAAVVCDHCATPIKAGADCWALSIWADRGGGPYYAWEHDYLE